MKTMYYLLIKIICTVCIHSSAQKRASMMLSSTQFQYEAPLRNTSRYWIVVILDENSVAACKVYYKNVRMNLQHTRNWHIVFHQLPVTWFHIGGVGISKFILGLRTNSKPAILARQGSLLLITASSFVWQTIRLARMGISAVTRNGLRGLALWGPGFHSLGLSLT